MNEVNPETVAVLNAAMASIRAEYITRYVELELSTLRHDRAELAKVGMDANIYAPYPHGAMSRFDFRRVEALYYRVGSAFRCTATLLGPRDPKIVTEIPDAESKRRATATASANAVVDSYVHKLAGKIAKRAVSATTNGNIWDCALLTVNCYDGEVQTWKTQCILNTSCLGKLFNQWPTRRVS